MKSSLTTQENFLCVLKCGMRALFIGEGRLMKMEKWFNGF